MFVSGLGRVFETAVSWWVDVLSFQIESKAFPSRSFFTMSNCQEKEVVYQISPQTDDTLIVTIGGDKESNSNSNKMSTDGDGGGDGW